MSDATFYRAAALEQNGDVAQATMMYQALLASKDPRAAINLGTIQFNLQKFGRAAEFYRKAIKIDPKYALGHYNLGNTLDELGRTDSSIKSYREAIRLSPHYADAHYNLALALDLKGERRLAIKHWRAYLKLDSSGVFAEHARGQIRKTLSVDRLMIVWRAA